MKDGGRKKAGENILLLRSVAASVDDKNMACQSRSRVKPCVGERERETLRGAGVQSRLLITCVDSHAVSHTKLRTAVAAAAVTGCRKTTAIID